MYISNRHPVQDPTIPVTSWKRSVLRLEAIVGDPQVSSIQILQSSPLTGNMIGHFLDVVMMIIIIIMLMMC